MKTIQYQCGNCGSMNISQVRYYIRCPNKKCKDVTHFKLIKIIEDKELFDNDLMFEKVKHLARKHHSFYDNTHFIFRIIKKELSSPNPKSVEKGK